MISKFLKKTLSINSVDTLTYLSMMNTINWGQKNGIIVGYSVSYSLKFVPLFTLHFALKYKWKDWGAKIKMIVRLFYT